MKLIINVSVEELGAIHEALSGRVEDAEEHEEDCDCSEHYLAPIVEGLDALVARLADPAIPVPHNVHLEES